MTTRRPTNSHQMPRRLLGVWAHPDDEAYLSAGLMGRVVDQGGRVTVVAATNGELGTGDTELAGSERFAQLRQRELRGCLGELGVTDVRFLDIADGGCENEPADRPVAQLVDVISEVRPDAIVTFGPDGITGHPDHRAVSSWVTAAWLESDQRADVLYAAMTRTFLTEYAELHDQLGLFDEYGDGPAGIDDADVVLRCSLTHCELERKRAALAQHASQTTGLAEAVGETTFRRWWRDENFRTPTARELATAAWAAAGRGLVGS
ncbi:MAG: PIG-L family deacetylase [Actinomycetota bacterium]